MERKEKQKKKHHSMNNPRKTKPSLRESENKFRDLAEKSLAGIYLIQDGVFRYVNPKLAEIFGYTVEELIDKKGPQDVVIAEDWPVVGGNIRQRIAGEIESVNYEFRGVRKNGEIINIEAYGSRITYEGEPAVIGTLLDVTERKRAESLLRQAEERYRSIFENAVEGIFQTTVEGGIIAANPRMAQILGYDSPEEYMSSVRDVKLGNYVDPELRTKLIDILDRDGFVIGFECQLKKKDGSRIWASVNARAVRDAEGVTNYYEGTLQDITEQKRAKEELQRLHAFNEAIIENAPVSVFTLDKNGYFTSVNPALAVLSGLGVEAEKRLIGFNWLKNRYTIKCGLAGYLKRGLEGEPFQLWDFPFMTYKGDRGLYIDFKGVPLKGKEGNIEGLLCIIEETTERVTTRAKLMQEMKMAAIGRLAAGAAHELNNPLATIVAYAEIACDSLESASGRNVVEEDTEKLKNYLNIIQEQAFRCKNVIGDLLSMSRKGGLEITDVEVNELIESVLEVVNPGKGNIAVIRELSPLPPARADASALRQVVVNLVQNAMDAVEENTGAAIGVKTSMDGDLVRVEIRDNGTGIPDSIVDKIFEPFFTTKESKKGIGLGLSLCYEFMNSMGGTIRFESRPAIGTTFFLTLPAAVSGRGG